MFKINKLPSNSGLVSNNIPVIYSSNVEPSFVFKLINFFNPVNLKPFALALFEPEFNALPIFNINCNNFLKCILFLTSTIAFFNIEISFCIFV